MKKTNACLLLLGLLTSLNTVADLPQEKNEFNGQELRQIRGVSQAILKTRGQDRKRVVEETKELRGDMALIKQALRISPEFHGATDLRGEVAPSNQIVSLNTSLTEQESGGFQAFFSRIKGVFRGGDSSKVKEHSSLELKEKRINAQLEKALNIVTKRKSEVEKNGPAVWTFWEEKSDIDARAIRVMERLELRFAKIKKAKGEEKQVLFEAMKRRIRTEKAEKPAEPTIFTITKHVRK